LTTSIGEAILQGSILLHRSGVSSGKMDAGSLLGHVLGRDRTFLITHADDLITSDQQAAFQELLDRRVAGEPLQYIKGVQEFFGLDFEVTPDVFIPRPETELLVEVAQKLLSESDSAAFICEVGAGSGCIGITLVHELPDARAVAVDISAAALDVARRNAARHAVAERMTFQLSDCFSSVTEKDFDIVVSNPPYVEERALDGLQREVRYFEPHQALTAGADGLAVIRRLLIESPAFLKPRGFLVFEIGFNQGDAVRGLIDPEVWEILGFHDDLQGMPRIIALRKQS
jgi:release factor glutamine methyltransferase